MDTLIYLGATVAEKLETLTPNMWTTHDDDDDDDDDDVGHRSNFSATVAPK